MKHAAPKIAVWGTNADRVSFLAKISKTAGFDLVFVAGATEPDLSPSSRRDSDKNSIWPTAATTGPPRIDFLIICGSELESAAELRHRAAVDPSTAVLSIGELRSDVQAAVAADVAVDALRTIGQLLAQNAALLRRQRLLRRRHRYLAELAWRDSVTDLPNRRAWDEAMQARDDHFQFPKCIAIFDIDHFKAINDQYGHFIGDQVLKAIGRQLAASVRSSDLIARIGGDEFAVLLSDCDNISAAPIIERLRTQCAEPAVYSQAGPISVTLSSGYCSIPSGVPLSLGAAQAADEALRQAKTAGRNRSCAATGPIG